MKNTLFSLIFMFSTAVSACLSQNSINSQEQRQKVPFGDPLYQNPLIK